MQHGKSPSLGLWHAGSSSLTRDGTWAPALGARLLATGPPGKFLILVLFTQGDQVKLEAPTGPAMTCSVGTGWETKKLRLWLEILKWEITAMLLMTLGLQSGNSPQTK